MGVLMNNFSVDLDQVYTNINKFQKKAYLLEDVKDRVEKVAFDVVRFRDNQDTDMLWKVEDSDDGPVIVALYDDELGALKSQASRKEWDAVVDDKTASINVFYKGEPVSRIYAKEVGIPVSEVSTMARWLPAKLASDNNIRNEVLSRMSAESRVGLMNKYPELNTLAART
jgi:hypothetical protein